MKYKRVVYVVPGFNFRENVIDLLAGFREQAVKEGHEYIVEIIDDVSTDGTEQEYNRQIDLAGTQFPCVFSRNIEKKYALRNIVEIAMTYRDDDIIAVVDADDRLCNPDATNIILDAYNDGADTVWTAQRWDVNSDMNVSKPLPEKIDPYQHPWCTSHLRTFKVSELKKLNVDNFKDASGEWFQRGYDQALMLPLLKIAEDRRYIDEVCYLYKLDSCSIPKQQRNYNEVRQLGTVNFVRARGFVKC
jgi:glycosyltransferase involved in cell wall biosynthesis